MDSSLGTRKVRVKYWHRHRRVVVSDCRLTGNGRGHVVVEKMIAEMCNLCRSLSVLLSQQNHLDYRDNQTQQQQQTDKHQQVVRLVHGEQHTDVCCRDWNTAMLLILVLMMLLLRTSRIGWKDRRILVRLIRLTSWRSETSVRRLRRHHWSVRNCRHWILWTLMLLSSLVLQLEWRLLLRFSRIIKVWLVFAHFSFSFQAKI